MTCFFIVKIDIIYLGDVIMAKKVEVKETVKKTTKKTTPKKKVVEKKEVIKEEKKVVKKEELDEEVEFEEFDDEDTIEVKKVYKEKKPSKFKRKKKEDVLGDSLLKQNAEIINFFKILIAVLIFIGVFYLIVALARGEIGSKKEDKKEEELTYIQNEEILASSTFNKKDKEYYVLFIDTKDDNASIYSIMYEDYKEKNLDVPMFYVDLSSKFNKEVISDDTNSKAQEYDELKVSSPTLIHIKNGKNVNYYENDEVKEQMIKLNK